MVFIITKGATDGLDRAAAAAREMEVAFKLEQGARLSADAVAAASADPSVRENLKTMKKRSGVLPPLIWRSRQKHMPNQRLVCFLVRGGRGKAPQARHGQGGEGRGGVRRVVGSAAEGKKGTLTPLPREQKNGGDKVPNQYTGWDAE